MRKKKEQREIIDVLLEQARKAAESLDVYQVSKKTKVKSVSGKTDDREETVVDTEELSTQRLDGCIDVARLRQLSAVLKELGDLKNQDDEGRLRELIDALWCADDEKDEVKK